MIHFIISLFAVQNFTSHLKTEEIKVVEVAEETAKVEIKDIEPRIEILEKEVIENVPEVPFYSQFTDIKDPEWKKVACGVVSLAMVIEYYKPETVIVNTLLKQGVTQGAYLQNAGWTYKGLISLGRAYGLGGNSYDFAGLTRDEAFKKFEFYLKEGPVIASVHYKFDPQNVIPHLVVINGVEDGVVYYNDPAAGAGNGHISQADFLKAWKKRFIVIRPV